MCMFVFACVSKVFIIEGKLWELMEEDYKVLSMLEFCELKYDSGFFCYIVQNLAKKHYFSSHYSKNRIFKDIQSIKCKM